MIVVIVVKFGEVWVVGKLRIPSLRGFVILLEGKNDARGGVVSRVTIRNLAVTIRKVPNV